MISKFALVLAGHFADRDIYKREEISIYKYGFELLLSTILNMAGILLISVFMDTVVGAVFFCAAFIPLRLSAGGYHAKHHWSCIVGFNIIFLAFAALHHYMSAGHILPYLLVSVLISSLLIWSLAPVEAVNKPLKDEQRKRQRQRSIIIACVNLAITLLFFTGQSINKFLPLFAFYNSGALAASLSLLAAEILNKQNRVYS